MRWTGYEIELEDQHRKSKRKVDQVRHVGARAATTNGLPHPGILDPVYSPVCFLFCAAFSSSILAQDGRVDGSG